MEHVEKGLCKVPKVLCVCQSLRTCLSRTRRCQAASEYAAAADSQHHCHDHQLPATASQQEELWQGQKHIKGLTPHALSFLLDSVPLLSLLNRLTASFAR